MAWSKDQIWLIKSYQRWAKVDDAEYRGIMAPFSADRTSKDPGLTNYHFDMVVRTLESRMEVALEEGQISRLPDKICDLYFFRRLPCRHEADSRQEDFVMTMFQRLAPWLAPENRNESYLTAIAAMALRRHLQSWRALNKWQMSKLIEALKDRLSYCRPEQKWPELRAPQPSNDAPF